ncbi:MAG: NAD(P)/FAD-dependent oxidoreductase, partial [Acidobacteria bacterium]|nr:NAD(P)/FAD-dependent oxidoreductase [Acidobacteriota bacterium]
MFDLAIIGGGPAGTAAAMAASASGRRVLVLERGQFPRHKVCGEFVSGESLDLLRELFGKESESLLLEAPLISRARLFVDGGVFEAEISPAACSIPRFDLDRALWRACQTRGVEARAGASVQAITGAAPFRIVTSSGCFEARAVINASGRWSNLTSAGRRVQTGGTKWVGVKAHFSERSPSDSVDLYFFDGGYCGVQPVANAADQNGTPVNACAMVRAEVATTIDRVLKQHPILYERSRDWAALTEPVSTSPLNFHAPQPVANGMFQAGDAAAFVDPFIGGGISLALRTGALAGECAALACLPNEQALEHAQILERYSREYQRRFG